MKQWTECSSTPLKVRNVWAGSWYLFRCSHDCLDTSANSSSLVISFKKSQEAVDNPLQHTSTASLPYLTLPLSNILQNLLNCNVLLQLHTFYWFLYVFVWTAFKKQPEAVDGVLQHTFRPLKKTKFYQSFHFFLTIAYTTQRKECTIWFSTYSFTLAKDAVDELLQHSLMAIRIHGW